MSAWAAPVAAADCTLVAPAYVNVGTPINIEGAGFPASTTIDVSLSIEGAASDEFSLQSDGGGGLQIALTPEDLDIGLTTVRATAGSACTAEVRYTVLAAGATPPRATAEPEEAPGASEAAGAPRTNFADIGTVAGSTALPWTLAFALVAAGCLGLFLTRSPRRR